MSTASPSPGSGPRWTTLPRTAPLWVLITTILLGVWACFPETPDGTPDTSEPSPDTAPDSNGAECRTLVEPPVEPGANRIRVATHNVRRLFDTDCDTDSCRDGFEDQPDRTDYRQRLERLAGALASVDADVLLLQEIETAAVLEDLRGALAAAGADYSVASLGEVGRPGSLDVGILSRGERTGDPLRFRDARTLARPDGSTTRFTREFLGLPLEIDGADLVVFNAHFKSKFDDDPGRRLAEARAARSIVLEAASDRPGSLVLLGGDLNDTPSSPPLEALTSNSGLLPSAHRSSAADRWTFCFDGTREAIDHVLTAPNCGGAYIEASARRWGGDSCPGASGFGGSDHAALSADFALD